MNDYCRHYIERFHLAFKNRSFDQDDVALFLLMARDYTNKGSMLRELGDFLAHPREKTKGLVLSEIAATAQEFDKFLMLDYANKRNNASGDADDDPLPFRGLDSEKIAKDVARIFTQAELKCEKLDIESGCFGEFLACLILLLEPFKLVVNGQTLQFQISYGRSIQASVTYESDFFKNHFAVLIVLALYNINTSRPPLHHDLMLSKHIARRHKAYGLIAISYENDAKEGFLDRKDYRPGEFFVLVR